MRLRLYAVLVLTLATSASAKEVFLTIAGSVGNFRTDTHIFNPSATKDIVVQATFLRAGGDASHPDNSAAPSKPILILRRSTIVYDDVVSSLFETEGLGGIRLQSDDDFLATQRIYADEAAGTLGQFIVGAPAPTALTKGVVMQLRSRGTGGKGSFRTNVGFLNPNATAVDVTVRLHDAQNNVAATKSIHMLPLGVIQPNNIVAFFNAASADLANAVVTFEATHPIFAYGSVIDNATVDPAYIAAQPDSGAELPSPTRTYDVTLRSYEIVFTPELNVAPGDRVVFRVRAEGDAHGFELVDPAGNPVIEGQIYEPGAAAISHSFTASERGTYNYYCTLPFCGGFYMGHWEMYGAFDVGEGSGSGARRTPPPAHAHHH